MLRLERSVLAWPLVVLMGCGSTSSTPESDAALVTGDAVLLDGASTRADAATAALPALCRQACERQRRDCGSVSAMCLAVCDGIASAPNAARCAGVLSMAYTCIASFPFQCTAGGGQPSALCGDAVAAIGPCLAGMSPEDAGMLLPSDPRCEQFCAVVARSCPGAAGECTKQCERDTRAFTASCREAFGALLACSQANGIQCTPEGFEPSPRCAAVAAGLEPCGIRPTDPPDAGGPDA